MVVLTPAEFSFLYVVRNKYFYAHAKNQAVSDKFSEIMVKKLPIGHPIQGDAVWLENLFISRKRQTVTFFNNFENHVSIHPKIRIYLWKKLSK